MNAMRGLIVVMCLSVSQACSKASAPSAQPLSDRAPRSTRAVVAGKALPGAIITLEPADSRQLPPVTWATGMGQFARQFVPDLVIASTGQPVRFSNSDQELHSVRVVESTEPTKAIVYNVVMASSATATHVFDKPGFYEVRCDFHTSMQAFIYVAATPYATRAGQDGVFTVDEVEPGSYRLTMQSEGRQLNQSVEIVAPRTDIAGLTAGAPN